MANVSTDCVYTAASPAVKRVSFRSKATTGFASAMYSAILIKVDACVQRVPRLGRETYVAAREEVHETLAVIDVADELDGVGQAELRSPLACARKNLAVPREDCAPVGTPTPEDAERLDRLQHAVLGTHETCVSDLVRSLATSCR